MPRYQKKMSVVRPRLFDHSTAARNGVKCAIDRKPGQNDNSKRDM